MSVWALHACVQLNLTMTCTAFTQVKQTGLGTDHLKSTAANVSLNGN